MARKVVQKGAHFILNMRSIVAEDLTHAPPMSAPRVFLWMSVGAVQVQPEGGVHHVSFVYYNTTINFPIQSVFYEEPVWERHVHARSSSTVRFCGEQNACCLRMTRHTNQKRFAL